MQHRIGGHGGRSLGTFLNLSDSAFVHKVTCGEEGQSAAKRRCGCAQQAVSESLQHYAGISAAAGAHDSGRPLACDQNDMQLSTSLIHESSDIAFHPLVGLALASTPCIHDQKMRWYHHDLGYSAQTLPPTIVN